VEHLITGATTSDVEGRDVIARSAGEVGNTTVRIRLVDDSGFCLLFIEDEQKHTTLENSEELYRLRMEQRLGEVWLAFRGLIDSSTNPRYSPQIGDGYSTEVAECATCTAMNVPILVSTVEEIDRWADLIADRFVKHSESLIDNLKSYPRKYRFWSNPRHFWNRHAVLNRTLRTVTMAFTDATYFRSFVDIYSDKITDVDTVREEIDLRIERLTTVSRFIEERMGSMNIGWLLVSILVAVAVGVLSFTLNVIFA